MLRRWNFASLSEIVVLLCVIVGSAFASARYIYTTHLNGPPIRSDGFGYYAYVTSIFIDRDLSFRTALANNPAPEATPASYGIGVVPETGHTFNKYFPGAALLQVPFFFAAHLLATPLGYSQSGYSFPYQMANVISGISYLALGLIFLYLTLRRFHSRFVCGIALLLVVFATNVFHYATYDGALSHVYSFALVSVYLFTVLGAREPTVFRVLALGLVFGLILLVRGANILLGILLLIPFLHHFDGRSKFVRCIGKAACAGGAALLVLMPLFLYWRWTTGHWLVNSYAIIPMVDGQREAFNWLSPELGKFLFSVDRGLLIWSPIVALSILAWPEFIRREGARGAAIVLILVGHAYICACWWTWSFGLGFGCRPFVEMMPLVALPLALFIERLYALLGRVLVISAAAGFCLLNCFLMYGYWHQYIPFGGTTMEIIWALPGRIIGQ